MAQRRRLILQLFLKKKVECDGVSTVFSIITATIIAFGNRLLASLRQFPVLEHHQLITPRQSSQALRHAEHAAHQGARHVEWGCASVGLAHETDHQIEHLRRAVGIDGREGAAQTEFVVQQRGDGVGVAVAADEAQ